MSLKIDGSLGPATACAAWESILIVPKTNSTYIDQYVGLKIHLKSAIFGGFLRSDIDTSLTLNMAETANVWETFWLYKNDDGLSYRLQSYHMAGLSCEAAILGKCSQENRAEGLMSFEFIQYN